MKYRLEESIAREVTLVGRKDEMISSEDSLTSSASETKPVETCSWDEIQDIDLN